MWTVLALLEEDDEAVVASVPAEVEVSTTEEPARSVVAAEEEVD